MRQRPDGDLMRLPESVFPFTSQDVVGIRTTLLPGLESKLTVGTETRFEQVRVSAYVSKCFPSGVRDCAQNSEH